jgi:hypothetical protein
VGALELSWEEEVAVLSLDADVTVVEEEAEEEVEEVEVELEEALEAETVLRGRACLRGGETMSCAAVRLLRETVLHCIPFHLQQAHGELCVSKPST